MNGIRETQVELSIVIVSWNVKELLRKCLQSIGRYTKDVSYEIIVVDNASADGSAAMVRKDFPQARLIANDKNVGFGAANNQAAGIARGRYILLLNPDTEIKDDAFAAAVKFMETRKDIGGLGLKLVFPDGTPQGSVAPPLTLLGFLMAGYLPMLAGAFVLRDAGSFAPVEQPTAACLLLRKDLFDRVGGFDERFFAAYEDVDLCVRLKKAGVKLFFYPDAVVIHHKSSCSRERYEECASVKYRSEFSLIQKYYGRMGTGLILASAHAHALFAQALFPVTHRLCGRPRDVSYFQKNALSRLNAYNDMLKGR